MNGLIPPLGAPFPAPPSSPTARLCSRVLQRGVAVLSLWAGLSLSAATLSLDFGLMKPGLPPEDFVPALTGGGPAPEWKIVQVDVASQFVPLGDSGTPSLTKETVLAQLSTDPTDERFPLLIYRKEVFADFKATLTFRTVAGRVERMAGLAFRVQNPTNYYVVRASSAGSNFRFYKFVDGVRSEPIGPAIRIPSGEWHTLSVECKGNAVTCRVDDRDAIPTLTDSSFLQGHLALWTKSDSVSHFRSLVVEYDEVRTLPRLLVERAMAQYPRLLNITVFGMIDGSAKAIASSDPELVGEAATEIEESVLKSGELNARAAREAASAVFPLTDRNGEPLFAVRLKMRSFPGQTANNAAARSQPISEFLQRLVQSSDRGVMTKN